MLTRPLKPKSASEYGRAPADVAQKYIKKFGKVPLGARRNNPGNLEKGGKPFEGEVVDPADTNRFRQFRDPESGIRAIAVLMIAYADRAKAGDGSAVDTCDDIINRYAPSSENNTAAYIAKVAKSLDVRPDERINVYDWTVMRKLVCAIIEVECGLNGYSDRQIDTGLIRAGIRRPLPTVVAERRTNTALGFTGLAAGGGATVLSTILAVWPVAQEAYRQGTASAAGLSGIAAWLPPVFGLVAAGSVVALAWRNNHLAKLVDGTRPGS